MKQSGAPVDGQTAIDSWEEVVLNLYRELYNDLVRLAAGLLDRRDLAEECVQEAFLRLSHVEKRPNPGREPAYLRSAVLNVARDVLRRRQVAERALPRLTERATGADAGEAVLRKDTIDVVRRSIASLPPRQREVIDLRFRQELSEAQIAAELGISQGSVKTHASRGRIALAAILAPFRLS